MTNLDFAIFDIFSLSGDCSKANAILQFWGGLEHGVNVVAKLNNFVRVCFGCSIKQRPPVIQAPYTAALTEAAE